MPIRGSEIAEQLDRQLSAARRNLSQHRQETEQLNSQLQGLVAQRSQALLELARHYLPDMTRASVDNTFAGIHDELLSLLKRKEQQQQELVNQFQLAIAAREKQESRLSAVTAELNAKVHERTEKESLIARQLEANPAFQALSQQSLQAEERLHRNEERLQDLQREAEVKLPPYDRSRLFQYLFRRRYATAQYAGRGLTRRLDGWVASLVKYSDARPSYELLKLTPKLMQVELQQRQAEFARLMQQLEKLQSEAADAAGLPAILAAGKQLGVERDWLVQAVADEQQRTEKLRKQITELEQSEGRPHAEALERFRSFLERTEIAALTVRAQQTPDTRDDELVAQSAALNRELAALQSHLKSRSESSMKLERQVSGMESLLRKFRSFNFDSDRSRFSTDLNVEETVSQYLAGGLDSDGCWQKFYRAQQFEQSSPQFSPTADHGQAGFSGTGDGLAQMLSSPTSRILMSALAGVAGAALHAAASRSMERRSSSGSWLGDNAFPSTGSGGTDSAWMGGGSTYTASPSFPEPSPTQASIPASAPDFGGGSSADSGGSFTSGDGF